MIRKAVIPAAGFGSRFLPATKSQPKEMLPVVDKPVIHYVVEEAVASGITDILMVIGKSKRSIEEYFDRNFELEAELEAKQKTEMLEEVSKEKVSRYGVMDGTQESDRLYRVHDFVEKPEPGTEPSRLVFAGRYVFTPEIFDYLVETEPGKNDEIQLTDAMRKMVSERPMYGRQIEGRRFDIGNKLDYIKTNVEFALQREDLRGELGEFIKAMAKELS